ncbi:efflux transporter outer membrane subunit [Diaphorobacter aerolatus]|uniref:Efflux transporter outer membrane subunit n=2 Tax=Diaphorobacter aerolatus TaxID=1288495 RepID=A0A7H0GMD3_9BURK|nr:efflux transporter outer membrane subunit [Diaphorobacter aerolatus]
MEPNPLRGARLRWRYAVALSTPLMLSACMSLAPDYEQPPLPVLVNLEHAKSTAALSPDQQAAVRVTAQSGPMAWQDFIAEPRLRELIRQALDNNRDLRVAILAIEKARAQYGIERAGLFPSVAATGAGSRSRTADDLTAAGRSNVAGQYTAQLGFSSYEIDFFGRVRNLNEAALQEFLRTGESRRSVQLSLIAEIANAWLTLDADARRLALARETLRTRLESLQLTERSHELGAANGLTLAQTRSTVDSARVDVGTYTSQLARDRNALGLLVGDSVHESLLPASVAFAAATRTQPTPLGTGPRSSERLASVQVMLPEPVAALLSVPQDLPSSVLLQRPDVQAAEHTLRGTYANIGAARAAFFPSITLTTSIGVGSNALSHLFDAGNGMWSFIPQIRLPIFDAGRNRSNLRVAEVARDTAVAQYEKTVQTAFREVSDALADRSTLDDRLNAQRSMVESTKKTLELSDARYRLGADNYLTVLDAQRSLYTAQQTQITLQLAEQVNRITIYKVLGGQWGDGALDREDVADTRLPPNRP